MAGQLWTRYSHAGGACNYRRDDAGNGRHGNNCVTPPHLSGNKDHCHFGKRPGPGGEFFEYCAVTGGAENPGETPGCSATLISAVQEVPG